MDSTTGDWGLATATFSRDRLHRYRLSRVWDEQSPRVNFIMLNPSTADAFQLDPTVRRCMGFAQSWDYGQVEVTNIFALRSTDPQALYDVLDPVGPGNDKALLTAAAAADLVVVAWGTHAVLGQRGAQVLSLLRSAGARPHYLRMTKSGHPGHPLYLPASCTPRRLRA
jgi:hypothetical protein